VSKRCVPGQHEQQLPSVDDLLVGQADSGTCGCDEEGVAKCLPSAIIIGIEKGSTAELKVSRALSVDARCVRHVGKCEGNGALSAITHTR